MDILFQFWGEGNWFSWIIMLIFWGAFFFFYPRLMLSQIMWKLERTAEELEGMSAEAKKFLIKEISENPGKKLKESVSSFFEFFMVTPVSLDPAGVVGKFDNIIKNERTRFRYFVNQVAPEMDEEKKASMQMGFAGGIEMHMIAKIIRHYVELIRQTKSYQIALIIQMQLPLIERLAKAVLKGTKSLARGEPVGDSFGPFVAAKLMGEKKAKEIEEDIIMSTAEIDGRECFVIRARGPGGRLGNPGKAVEKIAKKNRISRIISVDAAAKLEGEETGSIAEGVGVAMGGPGVERSYIEDVAVKNDIPLDSVVVKMKQEEAITPMRKSIKDASEKAIEKVRESVGRSKKGSKIIIVGVGNTSGVGSGSKSLRETERWVDDYESKLKAKKRKRRRSGFF